MLPNLTLASGLLLLAASVQAANLTIKVVEFDANGLPLGGISGVSVCYTSADGCSGARGRTGTDGIFVFQNVPAVAITVKASKAGFLGRTLTFKMSASDLFQQIGLQSGTGPDLICPQPSAVQVGNPTIQSVRVNGGAASTTNRVVTLTITATGGAITAFRAAEPENGLTNVQTLLQKPFIPISCTLVGSTVTLNHTLNLRSSLDNARYGGRSVTVQVKSGSSLSNYALDGIILRPVVQEYVLNGNAAVEPMFSFATTNGFTVQDVLAATCSSPPLACLQFGNTVVQRSDVECVYSRTKIFFGGRSLNPFWKLKSFTETSLTSRLNIQVSNIAQDVFRVRIRQTLPPRPGTDLDGDGFIGTCVNDLRNEEGLSTRKAILEGPSEDDFVDPASPWKNAFVQQ